MKLLDLFAGIGGFSLAGHWMGWETVGFVEWDDFCQRVLRKNFPGIPVWGDIVEFNKQLQNGEIITDTDSRGLERSGSKRERTEYVKRENRKRSKRGKNTIPTIDIITGGFPCQPFSQAGKRKGTDDSRYLWPEMLTTIRILKPPFVVGENVAGLVSMENGKTLERILTDLEAEGYTVESFIIPACGVGAWHRRDRIWILAYSEYSSDRARVGQEGEEKRIQSKNEQARFTRMSCGTGKDVSDTNIQGLSRGCETRNEYKEREESRNEQSPRYDKSRTARATKSELGGMVDGLSPWLDEPDIPRVAKGIKDRVNRLKALGNSIVPQVAFEIFKAIYLHNRLKICNLQNKKP